MERVSEEEKQLRKAIKTMKRNKVITSVSFITLGVILLVWPISALNIVCRVVGAALGIAGLVAVIMYLVSSEKTLAYIGALVGGTIVAVLGLWLFFHPEILVNLVPAILGILIIVSGVINVKEALTIHKERGEGVWITILLAVITIACGALILLNPTRLAAFMSRIMGVALVYDGVSDLWIISKITGHVREVEELAEDAQALDVTESARETESAQDTDRTENPDHTAGKDKSRRRKIGSFLSRPDGEEAKVSEEADKPVHSGNYTDIPLHHEPTLTFDAEPEVNPDLQVASEETPVSPADAAPLSDVAEESALKAEEITDPVAESIASFAEQASDPANAGEAADTQTPGTAFEAGLAGAADDEAEPADSTSSEDAETPDLKFETNTAK